MKRKIEKWFVRVALWVFSATQQQLLICECPNCSAARQRGMR